MNIRVRVVALNIEEGRAPDKEPAHDRAARANARRPSRKSRHVRRRGIVEAIAPLHRATRARRDQRPQARRECQERARVHRPEDRRRKARAARNARRYGLNLPVLADPALAPEVADMARRIAAEWASPELHALAAAIAEAQIDVERVRRIRRDIMAEVMPRCEVPARLVVMDRYEQRALSRRKFAIREFMAAILAKRIQPANTE